MNDNDVTIEGNKNDECQDEDKKEDTVVITEALDQMTHLARGTQSFVHSSIIKIGIVVVAVKIVDILGRIAMEKAPHHKKK